MSHYDEFSRRFISLLSLDCSSSLLCHRSLLTLQMKQQLIYALPLCLPFCHPSQFKSILLHCYFILLAARFDTRVIPSALCREYLNKLPTNSPVRFSSPSIILRCFRVFYFPSTVITGYLKATELKHSTILNNYFHGFHSLLLFELCSLSATT